MPRPALKPGQNSIATSKAKDKGKTPGKRGHTWYLQWFANIEGETKRYTTEIINATRQQVYDKAYERFDQLMEEARLPGDGSWTQRSKMAEFINKVCFPELLANQYARTLRDTTIARYSTCLNHYVEQVGKMSIASAIVPDNLQKHLKAIAQANGNPTAKQTKKIVSRYVMGVLVRKRIIEYNPLKNDAVEVTVAENSDKEKEPDKALLPEERRRVVDYLLELDPTMPAKKCWSAEVMTNKRKSLIDLTLLQATGGFRIGELRQLERRDVQVNQGHVTVHVRKDVSKTHKGRTVPILDSRVADRLIGRLDGVSEAPETLLFPAPASGKLWDAKNLFDALRSFYNELADELGIELLRERLTHVWRATLNSEWADLGVSAERRAAYFGHTPEVNRDSYTDFMDLSELERQVLGTL